MVPHDPAAPATPLGSPSIFRRAVARGLVVAIPSGCALAGITKPEGSPGTAELVAVALTLLLVPFAASLVELVAERRAQTLGRDLTAAALAALVGFVLYAGGLLQASYVLGVSARGTLLGGLERVGYVLEQVARDPSTAGFLAAVALVGVALPAFARLRGHALVVQVALVVSGSGLVVLPIALAVLGREGVGTGVALSLLAGALPIVTWLGDALARTFSARGEPAPTRPTVARRLEVTAAIFLLVPLEIASVARTVQVTAELDAETYANASLIGSLRSETSYLDMKVRASEQRLRHLWCVFRAPDVRLRPLKGVGAKRSDLGGRGRDGGGDLALAFSPSLGVVVTGPDILEPPTHGVYRLWMTSPPGSVPKLLTEGETSALGHFPRGGLPVDATFTITTETRSHKGRVVVFEDACGAPKEWPTLELRVTERFSGGPRTPGGLLTDLPRAAEGPSDETPAPTRSGRSSMTHCARCKPLPERHRSLIIAA